MITTIIIAGVSALFSYLNTGADRSTLLHTQIKKAIVYTPKTTWAPLQNEGRKMDAESLKKLERDYLNALYAKHIAYKTNIKKGVEVYYTADARENIYKIIDFNKKQQTTVTATTLAHNLHLNFFSEDGQLATLTDTDVVIYKRVFKNNELILETTEKANYTITLLLEDGFWRIRHLVKQNSNIHAPNYTSVATDSLHIKGINYYPKDTPWDMFGENFNIKTIHNDFNIINKAGLNTVRIFIPYAAFGKAHVQEDKLTKLTQVLNTASANQLKVVLTLFDFYGDYSVLDWTLNQQHATSIINTVKNNKALWAWDIKNEPNLDFNSRGKKLVVAWLNNMINIVKTLDPQHPVTIGWSNTKSATILKNKVDFISFHYYESLNNLDNAIQKLKKDVDHKPMVMQEFGISSYNGFWKPFGSSEKDQANYHKKAQEIIAKNNLQFMSWTLYDFEKVPKSVVGWQPWRKQTQKGFGFINKKGIEKEAFNFITSPK